MASSGSSTHPEIANIFLAQAINRMSGGVVVRPWEIDDLTEEWKLAFRKLAYDWPQLENNVNKQKAEMDRLINQHPTFRKYGKKVH